MEANMIRAHVFVKGGVQGIGYRYWTRKTAIELGLVGWVKNLADGRVEAVFEGDRGKVEEMIENCRQGSRYAEVDHLDISWEKATGGFKGFMA